MAEDEEELVEHRPQPWTVGRLRKELAGLPDDMALRVWVVEKPGGGPVEQQVIVDAGFGTYTTGGGQPEERVDPVFSITCEFPAGQYYRLK